MKRFVICVLAVIAALISPAVASDYRQCNIEVVRKKSSFNVGMASALVLERLAKGDKWSKAFEASDADRKSALGQFHSMTSSAVPSSSGGTVRPSDFAVLRLMARLNLLA